MNRNFESSYRQLDQLSSDKIAELEKKLEESWNHSTKIEKTVWEYGEQIIKLTKDRDMWKANHDNQVKLKSAIIDRLDCGDRARKVVALFDRIKELESAIENLEIKSSYDYHSKYYQVPKEDFLALIRAVNKK